MFRNSFFGGIFEKLSRIKKQTCIRLAKIELMFVCILYVSWTEDFLRIPWSNESFVFCSYLFLIQSEEEGKVTSLFDNDSIFVYKFETKDNGFILQRTINKWGAYLVHKVFDNPIEIKFRSAILRIHVCQFRKGEECSGDSAEINVFDGLNIFLYASYL